MQKTMLVGLMIGGFLIVDPSIAKETCEKRLEAAEKLTFYGTYLGQMLEFGEAGGGTQQEADAVKERWLVGKRRGIADLEKIMEDCEQQSKAANNSAEAAGLLAVVFEARLAWDTASPGSHKRDIYADAVAAISAIDHHEETGALIPFLDGSALEEWRKDPELGLHLMERSIDITERVYGKHSVERAEQLARLAYLFSPSTKPDNPHADPRRAEKLYDEALSIFEGHPEAMVTEKYRAIVGHAEDFYSEIGETERANALADEYAVLHEGGS